MKKECTKCKIEKELSEFRKDNSRVDGHQSWCKLCARKQGKKYTKTAAPKQKIRLAKHRMLYNELKNKLCCEICGEDENCCIDFHHQNNDKSFNIVNNLVRGWDTILEEINKCTVICSNCHRKVHAGIIKL